MGTGTGARADESPADKMTVVPVLVERGSRVGAKSANGEEGAGRGMTRAPPIIPDSWTVMEEVPP